MDNWTWSRPNFQIYPSQNFGERKKYKEERKSSTSIQFSKWDFEMASFAGTTQKCTACEKKVYWVEQLTADNKVYHKSCFRCHHCKGTLKVRPKKHRSRIMLLKFKLSFLCLDQCFIWAFTLRLVTRSVLLFSSFGLMMLLVYASVHVELYEDILLKNTC